MIKHLVPIAMLLAATSAAQTSRILVDLGISQYPSGGSGSEVWNDIDNTGLAKPIRLFDTAGVNTGITWDWPASTFVGANSAGAVTPTPGSALAAFPSSATRDVAYGSSKKTVVVRLTGLPVTTLVDFTFAASRMNVTDTRTADYVVQGFNGGKATLDASNNTTETVSVLGILPDATGTITVSIRAAATNDNQSTFYFYLGAVRMDLTASATMPPILGFDQPALALSRPQGGGQFSTSLTLAESTGAAPAISLSASDDATGLPPVWLSVPGTAVAGTPFQLSVDDGGLPLGTYSATLSAAAPGYTDALIEVVLSVHDSGVLNLLFYGNSFSQGNQGVPSLAGFIAEDAGHPSPNVVAKLSGGKDLYFHLTDPGQAAAITDSLPLGEQWDFVVMQGQSLEATSVSGDPAGFRADALAILTNVRAHSPAAGAVMFQTWAYGPGSSAYPSAYPDPFAMHQDISANYKLAVADQNAAFGPGTSFNGAAGDAVALLAFDPSLYIPDWAHPTARTTLLAAMTIYAALYRERVCDVQPDFAGGSNLAGRLAQIGLGAADWDALSGIAERVADSELRRYPGTSEDLLLMSGISAAPTACPWKAVLPGDHVLATLTSPNGLFDAVPAFLVVDAFGTGNPPGMLTPWPAVHVDPLSMIIVGITTDLSTGLNIDLLVPPSPTGLSLLLQGFALDRSAGNALFAATDGHEVVR